MLAQNITVLREEEDWYASDPEHFTKMTWYVDNDTDIKYIRKERLTVSRPKIKPFGNVAKCTPEQNKACTFIGDDVFIQRPDKEGRFTSEEEDNILKKKLEETTQKCRYCGRGHLSYTCKEKHLHRKDESMDSGRGGKYVPPSRREGFVDTKVTVKVSNLPEDIDRDALKELFAGCGRIIRCNVPRDRRTGAGRGFGFVDFAEKRSAEKAVVTMNNYRLNYCVLSVEMAENRDDKKSKKLVISAERIKEIRDEGDKKKIESIFREPERKYYQPGMRK